MLLAGRPVAAFKPELRAHVADCDSCRELASVASLILADARAARDEASLPTASVVWWRAQRRARREAERLADRPVRVTQAVAAACFLGVVAAFVWTSWPWLARWASWLASVMSASSGLSVDVTVARGLATWPHLGLLGVASVLALACLAIVLVVIRGQDGSRES
jgi:hypothetical protein